MSEIPNCPHCGHRDGIYRNVRAFGWIQDYFDFDGRLVETDIDNLRVTNSKTLRCCFCDGIRRDVVLVDDIIVPRFEIEGILEGNDGQ